MHWGADCCLACLERRLKRLLTISDFTMCPANRLAYAAVGEVSVVDEYERESDERAKKAWRLLRSRREQERQLPFDFSEDEDQEWDYIWSPSTIRNGRNGRAASGRRRYTRISQACLIADKSREPSATALG